MFRSTLSADSQGYVDFNKKPRVEEAYAVGKASSPYVNEQLAPNKTPKADKKPANSKDDEDDYMKMECKAKTAPVSENNYCNVSPTPKAQDRYM